MIRARPLHYLIIDDQSTLAILPQQIATTFHVLVEHAAEGERD